MAFLDEIDRKLTIWGHGAIQKTKEVSDTTKISGNIRSLENQKKECFAEIGKLYYSEIYSGKEREELADSLKIWIEKIDNLAVEIEEKRQQLSLLKGTIVCPNCNADIPQNSMFCNSCGFKIEQKKEIHNTKRCVQCGHGLDEQQMFCSNCGAKVEQQNIKIEDEQEEKIRCCNCGALLEAEQIFCTLCGTKIEKVVEATIIEDEKNLEETEEFDKKKCSKCGVELDGEQMFCTGCGNKIKENERYVL